MADCVRCARPVADTGYACHGCADGCASALLHSALLVSEVWVSVARLDRHGERGYSTAEVPLPFAWDAADADWAIRNTIGTWARHIAQERGARLPGTWIHPPRPAGFVGPLRAWKVNDSTVALMVWLAGQTGWLRMRPECDEALDELHDVARQVRRVVDSPPVLWYAGPCWTNDEHGQRCETDLYAATGATWVTCRECGASHDGDERRQWLLGQARNTLAHAGLIATALSALGHEVTSAQVRGYAHRGRILAHGSDERGRPQYLVGEVIDLVTQVARKGRRSNAA